MKALTIQQPYAHLIALPDDDARAKRVENRSWRTQYHGPLAIHAGKGRDYLEDGDLELYPGMAFGAIVAVCELTCCISMQNGTMPKLVYAVLPWLKDHRHVEGPVCWILSNVRRLKTPVPCRGGQMLWDVPPTVLEQVNANLWSADDK